MVKPLTFKGDKKTKKRKRDKGGDDGAPGRQGPPPPPPPLADADADADADAADDSWVSAEAVSDVVGPVMFVLPTDAPAALACDAGGAVFAMPVENMVDGNPASAEPHDVRQVWVASRVVGTESFRFKGHHGRYLACDATGRLSATSEAVSPLESFTVAAVAAEDGDGGARGTLFQLRTPGDTLPRAPTPAGARADAAAAAAAGTAWRIRMQARFKPRLRASRAERALASISRRELEVAAGRRLAEDEVRVLKRARREGDYHEKLLDIKVKGKHDKFA